MIDKKIHRHTMFKIIQEIFQLPYAQHIGFKWWTAAYFLHGLDRFSTDIDLDMRSEDSSLRIYDDIASIASKYGTVKQKKHLLLSYKSWYDNIKIDISRKIWKNNNYETINFYGTDIIVQDRPTLVANKLVAFLERWLNRDIYDMHYFLSQWFEMNTALILERTGGDMKIFRTTLSQKIKKLPNNYSILDGLWEVVNDEQKTFIKNKLISDLLGMIEFQRDFW